MGRRRLRMFLVYRINNLEPITVWAHEVEDNGKSLWFTKDAEFVASFNWNNISGWKVSDK